MIKYFVQFELNQEFSLELANRLQKIWDKKGLLLEKEDGVFAWIQLEA